MDRTNLNEAEVQNAYGPPARFKSSSIRIPDADIEIIDENLMQRLVEEIGKAEVVVGCIAWFTNREVLKALALKRAVSVVVQKEHWLKEPEKDWQREILALYQKLPATFKRTEFPWPLWQLSYGTDPQIEAVRCTGIYDPTGVAPKMHHKFLVFGSVVAVGSEAGKPVDSKFDWQAVWTGSCNATYNATLSMEDAILVRNRAAADSRYCRWINVLSVSEPLNWTHAELHPQWSVGP